MATVGSVGIPGDASAAEALKTNFRVRDATRFLGDPDLSKYGMRNMIVAYEDSLWPAGASRTQPNTSYIANSYIPKIRKLNPDVVAIDIETWPLKSGMTDSQLTANINKFKKVIAVFKREMPKTKIGLYLVMPERNWLAPCGDPKKVASRTKSWHERNLKLKTLASSVDIIFPSLYAFYSDSTCWVKYAEANVKEARQYGKPVWPFLWMRVHTTGAAIPRAFWRLQLETAYRLGDSMAIWSRAASNEKLSSSAAWWLETRDFLSDKKLTP